MKYNPQKLEKKWQKKWRESRVYEPDIVGAQKPFYNLMMFPYPSAEGLHVGNMYAFTGSDIYGRFKRMQGHDVFEPIGLDGFGIHSENYAMKIGAHPRVQAKISEKRFYKQMESIGNGFAWDERVETYNPAYYKWTQWLFIQMFKAGLAYRKKAQVNWCTSCLTVLSDEQAEGGTCERCSSAVIKKELEQWFFKITDYAERLLQNLDTLDWSDKVKIAQRHWIGKSEGAVITFKVKDGGSLSVFTTRPDTIMGVTFIAVAHGNEYAGKSAIHPVTGAELPIYATDYVVADYGTAAVMGVPAHDERDRAFAEAHGIYISDAPLMPIRDALQQCGGAKETRYRLRDWLVSRQRYWGPPIPMVECKQCGWQPVPEADLPILLPSVKNFRPTGTGVSPLASVRSFYNASCPQCGGKARRETDVSDTFLDSSWYFLRYPDARNTEQSFDAVTIKKWLPVDMYIGGAEHSVLHLLYSRFITMALHDIGYIGFEEPFTVFRAHGLLIKEGAKMSKSKGNVINPDEYIERYGADTLRTYLMFLAPFSQGGDFRDEAVMGVHRFLSRVWAIASKKCVVGFNPAVQKALHTAIKKVTEDIEALKYNTAISAMMIALRELEAHEPHAEDMKIFLQLLAPFAPHIAEELWYMQGGTHSIHVSVWPAYNATLFENDVFDLIVQINGKTKKVLQAPKGVREEEAIQLAAIEGVPQRVVFIPDKLINFIL